MEQPKKQNVPGDGLEQVEVSSPWFKMKIDDISWKTIIVVGMILASIVSIVYILAN
jgi:hypothetical protein